MKRIVFFAYLTGFIFSFSSASCQDVKTKEIIGYINNLLKNNPFTNDTFSLNTFYSVDVNSNNEFIISDKGDSLVGIIYKVKYSDLDFSFKSDSCADDTEHISWICKKKNGDNQNGCISAEFTDVEGKKETQYQESVYVLFSNKNQICCKLKSAFEQLFAHLMGS